MPNKKIKNATQINSNGIKFKSILESTIYRRLLEYGFKPEYEKHKYVIWTGYRPTVPFYCTNPSTNAIALNNKKLIDITYTPDFVFQHNNYTIIIEVKGFRNDVFRYKLKLFRKYLEMSEKNVIFAEIKTRRQLEAFIQILFTEYGEGNLESGKEF